jgi:hypothetical protein
MGRTFSNTRLLNKLKYGEYLPILNCVKNDDDLCIEMRIGNQAKIYYKKSLIMTLFPLRPPELLSTGYCTDCQPKLILNTPEFYFESAKKLVECHIKKNIEFTIQQKIAKDNSSILNQFLVIDMEYQFAQEKVENRTKEKTRFDLVALDLKHNKIILLELKQGLGSLTGKAGVDDHFLRYQEHYIHPQFQLALKEDVKGIIWSKNQLGLWEFNNSDVILLIDKAEIDFGYVFAAHSESELIIYKQQYGQKYTTLYLDVKANNYILNDGI